MKGQTIKSKIERYHEFENKKQEHQSKIVQKVNDWADFSLTPQTEDNIRERILHDKRTGENTICIAYICEHSKLSEEFIEELCKLTKSVDWGAISRTQELSEEFIIKHKDDVVWKDIMANQNLSNEFRLNYHQYVFE